MELSKEEKKAIEVLNNIEYKDLRSDKFYDNRDIVLNLVYKQQKEIEDYKSQKEEWFDLYNERVSDIINLEQEVEDLKEDNVTKDKIREIISKKRTKVLEKHDSKLPVDKQIYKRNVQVAMLDTLSKELLEENE